MIPKFRVWDKEEKIMIDWIDLDMSKDGGEDDFIVFEPTGPVKSAITNPILMQSTGLKDINGTEIYEGDIIKNSYDEIYTVKWFDAAFLLEEKYNGGFDYHELYLEDNKKVIGNIYETPESLEG